MKNLFISLANRSEILFFQMQDSACRIEILICTAAYDLSGNNIQLHTTNEMYYHYADEKIKYFFFFYSQNIFNGWFSAWKDILLKLCAEPTTRWLSKMKTNEKRKLHESTLWEKREREREGKNWEMGMFILIVYYTSFVFLFQSCLVGLCVLQSSDFFKLFKSWKQWCIFLVVP